MSKTILKPFKTLRNRVNNFSKKKVNSCSMENILKVSLIDCKIVKL